MTFDHKILDGTLRMLFDYWQGLCPSPGAFPKRAQITMKGLKPFLPYVSLIEKRAPDNDYYYRLKGTGFTNALGWDPTGQKIKDVLPESLLTSLIEGLDQVGQTGMPYIGSAAFDDKEGVHRKYTRLILPLADDGATIAVFLVYGRPEN
jgi:hypothetical protein